MYNPSRLTSGISSGKKKSQPHREEAPELSTMAAAAALTEQQANAEQCAAAARLMQPDEILAQALPIVARVAKRLTTVAERRLRSTSWSRAALAKRPHEELKEDNLLKWLQWMDFAACHLLELLPLANLLPTDFDKDSEESQASSGLKGSDQEPEEVFTSHLVEVLPAPLDLADESEESQSVGRATHADKESKEGRPSIPCQVAGKQHTDSAEPLLQTDPCSPSALKAVNVFSWWQNVSGAAVAIRPKPELTANISGKVIDPWYLVGVSEELNDTVNSETWLRLADASGWVLASLKQDRCFEKRDVEDAEDQDMVAERIFSKGFSCHQLLSFWRRYGEGVASSQYRSTEIISRSTTTSEVVRNIVIPETASRQCCYMDVMDGGPHRPNKLVSHWWGASFYQDVLCIIQDATGLSGHALAALVNVGLGEDKCKHELDATYWMCIFAVNQHVSICGTAWNPCVCNAAKYPTGHPLCEMDKFDIVMERMSNGLAVALDPMLKTLVRVWVVSEIGKSLETSKTIQYLLPGQLDESIRSGDLPRISIQDCQATLPADRSRIMTQIEESLTLQEFDQKVNAEVIPSVCTLLLARAVEAGDDIQLMKRLLKQRANAEVQTSQGLPIILAAAQAYDWDAVVLLASSGASQILPVWHYEEHHEQTRRYEEPGTAVGDRILNVDISDISQCLPCPKQVNIVHLAGKYGTGRIVQTLLSQRGTLQGGEASERFSALQALKQDLQKMDASAMPAIIQLLHDSDADVKESALQTLAQFTEDADELYVAHYVALLEDDEARIRVAAVQAIVRAAKTGDRQAIAAISRCLQDATDCVRSASVQALERLVVKGDPQFMREMKSTQLDPLAAAETRKAAVQAMAHVAIKGDQEAIEALSKCMDDCSWLVRLAAVQAIVEMAEKRDLITAVRKCKDDHHPQIRYAVLRAIAKLARRDVQRVISFLTWVPLLHDEEAIVMEVVCTAFAGDDKQMITAVSKRLECGNDHVREAAVQDMTLVAQADDPEVFSILLKCLEDAAWRVRLAAVQVMADLAKEVDQHASAVLSQHSQGPTREISETAVQALAKVVKKDDQQAIAAFSKCLEDEAWQVRVAALQAIAHIAKKGDEQVMAVLRSKLDDVDWDVRFAGQQAIDHIAAKTDSD
eukprot:TRINITY_DN48850_c0_g1_i1.p1 TRINITY_DN48850_c0_g1~~TRINITY_DN48850_c0_g1_i1.p1  ORF type:complete len:1144 (+),score=213.35 TRINITY_DN48850_c0_g1_i1:54-3485(+)